MKVNFSSCVFCLTACFDHEQGTSRHVHSSMPTLVQWGAVVGRHASLKALFRSPSFIDSSPVLLLLLFHLYYSLLKIPKKLWLQIEKISASYRYAFRFRSSLSKRFDFFFSYSAAPDDLICFASLFLFPTLFACTPITHFFIPAVLCAALC